MALTTLQETQLNNSNEAMQRSSAGTLLANFANITASYGEVNSVADVSANGSAVRSEKVALPIVASTDAQDTTLVIPAGSVIEAVYVKVTTKEDTGGTKTVDIGISGGDENGFLAGVSVAAAGLIKGTLLNSGQTLGALLSVDEDGSGALVPEPYVCTAATTIAYSLGSADFEELVASVIVKYTVFA